MKLRPTLFTAFLGLLYCTGAVEAQSTYDLMQAANITVRTTDSELDVVYDSIVMQIRHGNADVFRDPDPIAAKHFERAQQAWRKYREAQIDAIWPYAHTDSAQSLYGSSLTFCADRVYTQITLIRVAELENWLAELTGKVNGDICNEEIFGPILTRLLQK